MRNARVVDMYIAPDKKESLGFSLFYKAFSNSLSKFNSERNAQIYTDHSFLYATIIKTFFYNNKTPARLKYNKCVF